MTTFELFLGMFNVVGSILILLLGIYVGMLLVKKIMDVSDDL